LTVGSDIRAALDNGFPVLNTAVSGKVFGVEIPIVGPALQNTGIASSIANLKTTLDAAAATLDAETDVTKIANELQTALGSPYTVMAAKDTPNPGDYKFTINRQDTLATISSGSFKFDVGLPGLGLKASGPGLTIKLGDQFNINFVVPASGSANTYFVATGGGNHDFSLTANLSLPNFSAQGNLGLFQINAEEDKADNAANDTGLPSQGASSFNPTFNFDLPSGQLKPSDVANGKASVSGEAMVNLGLVVSFGGSTKFPSFKTNFHLDWKVDTSDTTQPLGGTTAPTVQFKSVEVDAGSYISQFLGPILQDIQTVTRPLQPLIDILQTPVPVISDLLGHKETFLDMVSLLSGGSNGDTVSFVKSVVQIIGLVNSIPTGSGLSNINIPFGDFDLGKLTDVRSATPSDLKKLDLSSLSNSGFFQNLISNLEGAGGDSATVGHFLNQSEGGEGGSFQASFPIIDNPINVFGLFLGKPVDLFDLTLPDLTFGSLDVNNPLFDQFFPVLGPLGVELKGYLGAKFHVQVGYDTYGLTSGDPLQGFFISDNSSATIAAGIHAYAALNVVVFSAGVGGGIDATIKFTPMDPDDDGQGADGKLRPKEIGEDLNMGPFCVFHTDGKITASLDAFIKVGFDTPFGFVGWQDDYTIAMATLLDFSGGCGGPNGIPQPTLGHISKGSGEDNGIPAGYLVLNMGPFAGDRGVGDTNDDSENFAVSHVGGVAGDETVQIDAMGTTSQPIPHIKGIYAEGGDGNNIITIKAGVLSPVTLYGGFNNALHPGPHNPPGHNQLYSADGPATLFAGDGGDHLVAGAGDANIYGGNGDDDLVGGTGHCYIKAGPGHSKLRGGGGVSTLDGNNGASDIETAGSGDDTLIGGTGGNNTYVINNPYDSSHIDVPSGQILTSASLGIRIFGHGASNQLILAKGGGAGFTETYNYGPGNGDGTIMTTNGASSQKVTFTGLGGPIFDTVTADSATLFATGGPDTINIGDGTSSFQTFNTTSPTGNNIGVSIDSFAPALLADKTTVTVNALAGGDTATIDSKKAADKLTTLNLILGSGTNLVNVRATPTGVTTTVDGTAAGGITTFEVHTKVPTIFPFAPVVDTIQGALVVKGGGNDTMNVNDAGNFVGKTGTLTPTTLKGLGMGPSGITYSGLAFLNIYLGAGGNNFTINDINPATVTSVDGGFSLNDSLVATFALDFNGKLVLTDFEKSTIQVARDFNGYMSDLQPGTVQQVTIGRSLTATGSLIAGSIDNLSVVQDVAGLVQVLGNLGTASIGGSVTGTITVGGNLTKLTTGGDVSGTVQVTGDAGTVGVGGSVSGTIQVGGNLTTMTVGQDVSGLVQVGLNLTTLTVNGSVTAAGKVLVGGDLTTMKVGQDLAGLAQVGGTLSFLTVGNNLSGTVQETGTMQSVAVGGSLTYTGLLSAVNAVNPAAANVVLMTIGPDFFSPGHDMAGRIVVSGTLTKLRVAGGTPGTIQAGQVGSVCVYGGFGPLVLQIKEAGVQRRVEAAVPANPYPLPAPPPAPTPAVSPAGVTFQYVYESLGLPSPQLTARVTNTAGTGPDQFDLSLVVYSDPAKFNLARLDAAGVSGIRNVAVEGDVLTAVTPAAAAFFKLPSGGQDPTPAGVQLPLDALAGVGVRNNVTAGTVRAGSLMGVAFGSVTEGSLVEPATDANQVDAEAIPTKDTAIVQAKDTFRVPFGNTQPVAFFLCVQKEGKHFDSKGVLFTDQGPNDARGAVTALVSVTVAGNFATIQRIDLRGDYGSIQTKQDVGQAVTSTGPLGDLFLRHAKGIEADVTASSIIGSIDSSSGPISGTIQTTGQRLDPITGVVAAAGADFGRLLTDPSGKVVGTTTVHAVGGGVNGRLISRGNFLSQVTADGGLDGVLAVQGDLGAAVGAARYGGVLSNGPVSGQVVVLGNLIGDFVAHAGLKGGRVAVKGSVLGNLVLDGGIDAAAALVVGGAIGDATAGTGLTAGNVKGIVAAKGAINITGSTNTQGAAFFQGNLASGDPSAAAIDAIFTEGNQALAFDDSGLDLKGLGFILKDLAALHVGTDGKLTGPVG
jgi:hypothetical protein